MSLQIWLPLIDNLNNYGLASIQAVANSEAIVPTTGGKIANTAYDFNSYAKYAIRIPYTFNTQTSYTICIWFKTPSLPSDTQWIFNSNTSTGNAANTHMGIYFNSTQLVVRSGGMANHAVDYVMPINTWQHIVQCLDVVNNKVSVYLNGELFTSYDYTGSGVSTSRISIGGRYTNAAGTVNNYGLLGQVNDFRLYDHILSAAEIKELARGLVLHYRLDSNEGTQIIDESGYEHNGTIYNGVTFTTDSARHSKAALFATGSNMYIKAGRGGMVRDAITVNIWASMDTWTSTPGRLVSCTQSGGWNFEYNNGAVTFACGTGASSNSYRSVVSNILYNNLSSGWHMFTGTYDGFVSKIYVDGVLGGTYATPYETKTPLFYHSSNSVIVGAEASASGATTPYFKGKLSDFRIYATALSAEDIQQLYQNAVKIDNLGNIHSYEIVEGEESKILKNGQLIATNVIEYEYMSYLKYDPNLYFEPDGSVWVHMYHHDAPYTNGVFTNLDGSKCSNTQFEQSIYLDEYRWFNVELCNYVNKWEIITKRRATNSGDFVVNRWIQPVNPMTASTTDVPKSSLIQPGGNTYMKGAISTYNNYSNNYCGYAHFNSSNVAFSQAYLCASGSNGTSWYGAIGAKQYWSSSRKDTTSFNTTSTASGISTGSVDLYLRIDNVTWTSPTNAKTTENKLWVAPEFIER